MAEEEWLRKAKVSTAVAKITLRNKIKSVEYKGGKCCVCGYKNSLAALSFHHLDRKTKEFSLTRANLSKSWERIKTELDKCILVCANCHMEIEHGVVAQR